MELAWPVVGLFLLSVLAGFVDTAMCARVPDAEAALAALGFSVQVFFMLMTAMFGLSVGAVALVSRAHGAGHDDRVGHVLGQATQLTILLGLVVGVVGNLCAHPLLTLMGASDPVADLGAAYLRPVLGGAVFQFLVVLYGGLFRGLGNTRIPFMFAIVTNVINAVANYGLILGHFGLPAMGVEGAGYGTLLAFAITGVMYFVFLTRPNPLGIRLVPRLRPLDPDLMREFLRVGAPAAADSLVLNLSFLSVIGFIGHLDEIGVAAHGVGLRVQAIAFVPGLAVSLACGALVGQALGRGDVAEARSVARAALVICMGIMSTLAVTFLAFAGPIIGIFDVHVGTHLGDLSVEWIQILGIGMPIFGAHIALQGVFQGAGATGISLRINLISTFFFQIPSAWLLGYPLGLGPFGVWASFPIGAIVKVIMATVVYRSDRWAKRGVKL